MIIDVEKKILHIKVPERMMIGGLNAVNIRSVITGLKSKLDDRYTIVISPDAVELRSEGPLCTIVIDANSDMDAVMRRLVEFAEEGENENVSEG